jgi:hypothetical protein
MTPKNCPPKTAFAVVFWLFVGLNCASAVEPTGSTAEHIMDSVWARQQSEFCMVALRQAERRYHLPPRLLISIARSESGRAIESDVRPWPWTINADGSGLFLGSNADAISWVENQASDHTFVDVGCMQIDLHYHREAFASIEEAFDPTANADYAARFWSVFTVWSQDTGGT